MSNCQIFTPELIVKKMLDEIEYYGENILGKTIFEPSFGDGAFLTEIVNRLLSYSIKRGFNHEQIYNLLSNVYGIEIDPKYYAITLHKLNKILADYELNYDWPNIKCENTLTYVQDIKFDFAVMNPPYIKIKDIDADTRKEINNHYDFGIGNTDLYVIFFELCINQMNENGRCAFITPNSYFKNTSQSAFRRYLSQKNIIKKIIDYGKVKVFDEISAYTAITVIDFSKTNSRTEYSMMKTISEIDYSVNVDLNSFDARPWTFVSEEDKNMLKQNSEMPLKLSDICDIQHGIATNADKIYIVNGDSALEQEILRPVTKASTLNSDNKIIFPYLWNEKNKRYEPIQEDELKNKYPDTYKYLLENKSILAKRDIEKNILWYQYARSQGIQNSNQRKIAIKHVLSENSSQCEIKELDENTLVYSGIYIVVKDMKNYEYVKEILLSEHFNKYLKLIGKDMSGGYKNVSAKMIKNYGICLPKEKGTE